MAQRDRAAELDCSGEGSADPVWNRGGNKARPRLLKIDYKTIHEKVKKLGIQKDRWLEEEEEEEEITGSSAVCRPGPLGIVKSCSRYYRNEVHADLKSIPLQFFLVSCCKPWKSNKKLKDLKKDINVGIKVGVPTRERNRWNTRNHTQRLRL